MINATGPFIPTALGALVTPADRFLVRTTSDLDTVAGAVFSRDERYRYLLWRSWRHDARILVWFMLNPSTATEEVLDNTIHGCMKRAIAWGYGAIIVINLFAFRSTDPKGLAYVDDPIGPENDFIIDGVLLIADRVICGWGNDDQVGARGPAMLAHMRRRGVAPHALKTNKNGSPQHPLYIAHTVAPFEIAAA